MYDDVLTRNDDEELSVRVVNATEQETVVNPNDVYTRDTDGNLAIRTVGNGGGGGGSVTSVNGQTGAVVLNAEDVGAQETLVSGTNIKTINGNSVMGSGNLQLSTFLPFPAGWTTNSTTKAFCDDVVADASAVKGMAYLGEVTCSDLPAGIGNSEIKVYIEDGTTAANKVVVLELTSGNIAPYKWQYTYWNNGTNVSGWVTWQEPLVSGTNIKTVNGNSLLGSGNIVISGGVPQYTTMPTATAGNVGEICQYAGSTDATYTNGYFYESCPVYALESATISQTVGSTLANILINIETFKEEEQPTGDETVNFVYTKKPGSAAYTTIQGAVTFSGGDIEALFDAHGWATQDNGVFWWTGTQWSIGPQVGSTWFNYTAEQLESDFGIIVTTTGEIQLNDNVAYVWTPSQYVWEKNNVEVDISDYGISYENWPDAGDTLTVVYTAPAISGYVWKEKEVQEPGIKWATSVDLASNVKPYDWDIYPAFTIAGGLPDGDYEFYYQAKVSSSMTQSGGPLGAITYKFCFSVNNATDMIRGSISPVIDGNWIAPQGKRLPRDVAFLYGIACRNANDDIVLLFSGSYLSTDVHGYNPEMSVPGCFKLSAIKNTATGEEYVATGAVYNDEPYNPWNDNFTIEPLIQSVDIPTYFSTGSMDVSNFNCWYLTGISLYQSIWRGVAEVSVAAQLGNDRLSLTLKTLVSDYELTIDSATGVFANTQVGVLNGTVYIIPNLPNGTTGTVYYSVGSKGGEHSMQLSYETNQLSGITMLNELKVGVTPTVANYLGKICQYDGATTASYTNGHFYKATGTLTTVPSSVNIYNIDPSGTTVTMDVDSFVSAAALIMDWGDQEVINNLNNGYQMRYDALEQTLYWGAYGTFSTADTATLMAYITISPAPTGNDIVYWSTNQYTAPYQVLTNGAWEEVAVQTTATAPSTLPVLLAADWSSNTQTVSVQGVTASNFIIVSPAPASATDYAAAGILCTAQASNSLTFTCTQTPSNDIDVNVLILG